MKSICIINWKENFYYLIFEDNALFVEIFFIISFHLDILFLLSKTDDRFYHRK